MGQTEMMMAEQKLPPLYLFDGVQQIDGDVLKEVANLQSKYGDKLGRVLTKLWGEPIRCTPLPITQVSMKRFFHKLPHPSLTALVDISPFYKSMLFSLDAMVVQKAVTQMLKQRWDEQPHRQNLNSLERALILKFIHQLLKIIPKIWDDMGHVTFSTRKIHFGNPEKCQFPHFQGFVNVPFLLENHPAGMINIGLPYETMGDLQNVYSLQATCSIDPIRPTIEEVPVKMRAVMAEAQLSKEDAQTLQPGDLVLFNEEATKKVYLKVGETVVAKGQCGLNGNYKGVQL